jgi:hypothetical protein
MQPAFEYGVFIVPNIRYFCIMQLNMLKTYWVILFLFAISIVKSDVSLISAALPELNEQVQQGTSHERHYQFLAEPVSNVEDELDESRKKNGNDCLTFKSNYFVVCISSLSPMVGFLFRYSACQSSIPIRLRTSIFRI